uniref:RNA-directed RNA polymerase n=1 Tax=Wenling toti-like virus 3 TaxID=1923550 RepID=A0A1L3KFC6_9VIRU|nr:hypothetical protein 2 [Wenling toti-like virus 3]
MSSIIDMIQDQHWDPRALSEKTNNLFTYEELAPADCYAILAGFVSDDPRPLSRRRPIVPLDSSEACRLWKPRTRADTRNTRLTLVDLWPVLPSATKDLLLGLDGLDLITITNLAVWSELWGVQHLESLWSTGALNDPHTMAQNLSKLSAFVKRVPGSQQAKQMFCEASTLLGYVHEPWPDFKFEEEVPELAVGGRDHSPEWLDQFRQSLDQVSESAYVPSEFTSFEDFVRSGEWMTAGAASVGSVEWTWGEEKGKFKARKNMVTDIYSEDEIWQMATEWDGRVLSRPFTKNELGKIRLAVATGFAAYLNEAYLFKLFGGSYQGYTGITLDERPLAGHNRMVRCVNAFASGCYGLPWDYKRFDHQVSTDEMEAMFDHVLKRVEHLLPAGADTERAVLEKVRRSYRLNYMTPSESGVSSENWDYEPSPSGRVLFAPPGHGKSELMKKRFHLGIADTDDWPDCDADKLVNLARDNPLVVTNRIELLHSAAERGVDILYFYARDPSWSETLMAKKVDRKHAAMWAPSIACFEPSPTMQLVELATGEYVGDYLNRVDLFCGFKRGEKTGRVSTPEYHVKGGLPSGIRGTSVYGNLWNAAMTNTVRSLARRVLGYDPVLEVALKGDDALLIARHPAELYVLRVCYAACNLDGNDAKFGISQGQGEFLRDEYSPEYVRGWCARLIPSITQYKPWSGGTWDPNEVVKTVLISIHAVERRAGQPLGRVIDAAVQKWTRVTRQSAAWLSLPTRLGGFGLLPWRGLVPSRQLPRARRPIMKFEASNTPVPTWIAMTPSQHKVLCDTTMTLKTHDIDVPGTAQVFARPWVAAVRRTRVTWRFDEIFLKAPAPVMAPTIHDGARDTDTWPDHRERNDTARDPDFPDLLKFLREYTLVKRSAEFSDLKVRSLGEYLADQFPLFWQKVQYYESRGWHRTDAIELAKGCVPTEPILTINPMLTGFVQNLVRPFLDKLRRRRDIAAALSSITSLAVEAVRLSPINRLYLW